MSRDFVNLPSNYKDFLNEVKTIIDNNLFDKIKSNKLKFKEILNLHNNINDIGSKYNCSSYDINRLINNYKKDNEVIQILKKISSLRNKFIVYHAKQSDYWELNIKNLQDKLKKHLNKKESADNIEKLFIKVIKKYKYDWDGLWSVIEMGKSGNIKNIELFDLDDLNELITYLQV